MYHCAVSFSSIVSCVFFDYYINALRKPRVSYIGITSAFQADERGSTPLTRSTFRESPLECFTRKAGSCVLPMNVGFGVLASVERFVSNYLTIF